MPRRPRQPKTSSNQSSTYRNPPEASRFKKGQSGNPAGRPKGSRSAARVLEAALEQTVTIRVRGRRRKVTKLEAMMRTLTDKAVAGDARMVRLLLDRLGPSRADEEPETEEAFSAADREVIAAMLARLGGKA
jgi:hypothetical protein